MSLNNKHMKSDLEKDISEEHYYRILCSSNEQPVIFQKLPSWDKSSITNKEKRLSSLPFY